MVMMILGILILCGLSYIIGYYTYHKRYNEKIMELKMKIQTLNSVDMNTHQNIKCPNCGNMMELDTNTIRIHDNETIELIYHCPYCSTEYII